MEHLVPERLASLLRDAGLHPAGPLGARGAVPRWSALDPDGGRWAVISVPAAHGSQARERAARLAAVTQPNVAQAGPALTGEDGSVVLLVAAEPGTDLELLAAARGPLDEREAVGVLVPVAEALGALHAAGLAHGAFGPADVVLTDTGPVVVDAGGGAEPLPSGDALMRCQVQDVAALVALAAQLGGAGGAFLAAVTPGIGADELARRWAQVAAPRQVALPDAAVLARLALRRLADQRIDGGAPGRADRTTRRTVRQRRSRARARTWSAVALATGLAVAVVVITAVLGHWPAAGPARAESGAAPSITRVAQTPAQAAAVRLSLRRVLALAGGNAAALRGLTEPGSPAALGDEALLRASGARREPLDLVSVDVLAGPVREVCPSGLVCVPVSVRTRVSGAQATRSDVVLGLRPGTWQVVEVSAAD